MQSALQTKLFAAVLAIERFSSATTLRDQLHAGDVQSVIEGWTPTESQLAKAALVAGRLTAAGVGVLALGEERYPRQFLDLTSPPPLIFYIGNPDLALSRGIGICGSRDASPAGLAAARACGVLAAREGLTVVSGYAKGVDTEAHLGALEGHGRTIAVLAEGILHFRWKRAFRQRRPEEFLVLSQFPPAQTWTSGGAMKRNALIVGLGTALVVIEARASGGTYDAGLKALALERPVLALEFASGVPPGNRSLIERGAYSVRSPGALARILDALEKGARDNGQLQLALE